MAQATVKQGVVSTTNDIPLLALIVDDTTRETLRAVARQMGWNGAMIGEGGAAATRVLLANSKLPGVLLLDVSESQDAVFDVANIANLCGPATAVIAVGLTNDVRLYRNLREAGARDYLVKPVSGEVLKSALAAALQQGREAAPAAAKGARRIALVGSRGGAGSTTLALSAAWDLAQRKRNVVLLDLDLHFGSAALSLDIEPGRGLRELLAHPDRIDTLLIDAAVGRAGDHLRILSGEEPLEDTLDLNPEGLVGVLDALSDTAEFVVIDVPRVLGPISRQVLGMCDVVAIVTDLSLPAMRDTQRLVSLITGARGGAAAMVIANKVGGVGGEIGVTDFERAIGAKIDHSIRFDKAAAVAAAEGAKPMIEAAKLPQTVAALRAMTQALSGEAGGGDKPPAKSLMKRVFGA
jgi:pilus assembly protein CpaE